MSAPHLDPNSSLDTVRDELVYLNVRVCRDPRARDLAPRVGAHLAAWRGVQDAQHAHWDAQTGAQVDVVLASGTAILNANEPAIAELASAGGGIDILPIEGAAAAGRVADRLEDHLVGDPGQGLIEELIAVEAQPAIGEQRPEPAQRALGGDQGRDRVVGQVAAAAGPGPRPPARLWQATPRPRPRSSTRPAICGSSWP